MKRALFFSILLILLLFQGDFLFAQELKVVQKINPIGLNEPSDLLYFNDTWYACGNKAFVYESKDLVHWEALPSVSDFDLEAITTDGEFLYISEETYQRILVYDTKTKNVVRTIPFKHGGGRNEGIEAMTFLSKTKTFLLVTEKDPCIFYEVNRDFQIINQFQIDGIDEVSSIGWYNNNVFVLSDEDAAIYELDWTTKAIKNQIKIPLINPEGFVWLHNEWIVCSDDMKRIVKLK